MPIVVAGRRGLFAACALVIQPGEVVVRKRAVGALHMACSDRPADSRRNLYPSRCELCGLRLARNHGELFVKKWQDNDGRWQRHASLGG